MSADPQRQPGADESQPRHESDVQTFERLARLSPLDYERCREAEAKRLGIRVPALDAEVKKRRPGSGGNQQSGAVSFEVVAPWPGPVNGVEVLDLIAKRGAEYLVLPEWALDLIALWCAHTHVYERFQCTPRLNITSPEKRCGKTTTRDFVGLFVPRPVLTENLTCAVLFRLVEQHKCTILADEVDCWLRNNRELLGLLNSGYTKGGRAFRCEGDANEVRGFNVFAPAVLCGIGGLPPTLFDRCIPIRLERARQNEKRRSFDLDDIAYEQELCRKLVRWCNDIRERLNRRPELPAGAFNRVADNWRPIFAIAETAGGDWPERAARAFEKITDQGVEDHGKGVLLLLDIRSIFEQTAEPKLPSHQICNALRAMEERPWPEWGKRDEGITPVQLAKLLRPFKVQPRDLKLADGGVLKGYHAEDFHEAFERYIPPPSRDHATSADLRANASVSEALPPKTGSASNSSENPNVYAGSSGVAGESRQGL